MRQLIQYYQLLASSTGQKHAAQAARAEIVGRLARRLAGPRGPYVGEPTLGALARSGPTAMSHEEVLTWLGIPAARAAELSTEFEEVSAGLADAYAKSQLPYPRNWAVESATSIVLYSFIRERRPATVVETGVANGHSSYITLSALRRNDHGQLVSVDVSEDVGVLVPPDLTDRWTKVILDEELPGLAVLRERLRPFMPFDVFFHDSDHRYPGQMLDYTVAAEGLAPDGLLMSDDIDVTGAWLDAAQSGLLPVDRLTLIDHRKAIGFARRAATGSALAD